MGGEEFRDSEVLAHFKGERLAGKLELENVAVVIDLLFTDDLKLGLDGFSVLPGYFLEVGRVAELVDSQLLGDVEPLKEVVKSDHRLFK